MSVQRRLQVLEQRLAVNASAHDARRLTDAALRRLSDADLEALEAASVALEAGQPLSEAQASALAVYERACASAEQEAGRSIPERSQAWSQL